MGPDADALKRGVLSHAGAVDALIPLLKDPDPRVADLAAYILRDAPVIDAAYLPHIVEGLDRGLGWLPPALARIGTDEAAKEAVARYLVSDSAPHNQEAYALKLFGDRAIPFILERAACTPSCREDTHYLLGAVLAEMGPERAAAGPELLRIVNDRNAMPQAVQGALVMIAALGPYGKTLEQGLLQRREHAPYLSPWIDRALIGIHSNEAGRIFAARLANGGDEVILRDLAEVGGAGHDAGPAVLEILKEEPQLRAAAATTLGYIGYSKATPALIEALGDPADVTLAWSAAHALGRMGARDALEALDHASVAHWYAPVRDAAQEAAKAIRSGKPAGPDASSGRFAGEFFSFRAINQGLPRCQPDYDARPESTRTKLYYATAQSELEGLKYPAEVVSFGAADQAEQMESGADIIKVHAGNLVEHREAIQQTPHVALRVDDGWLVGGNRGEWGGELVFVADGGKFQPILDENVEDIHRLGNRIVATIGLAHLGLNRGTLAELVRRNDGRWQASAWRVLPGAPAASSATPQGLLVAISGGGAILIGADGSMQMAGCPP